MTARRSMRAAAAVCLAAMAGLSGCLQDEAAQASTVEGMKATGPLEVRVTVRQDQPGRPANPAILGSNVQWVDHGDELIERSGQGFAQDMLSKVKALKPAVLRYPGGSLSDLYHWRDGMGDLARRGYNEHFYARTRQKIVMGTQEFLELCEEVGAEPLITVNTASGTPEEAAAWVEAVNKTGMVSRTTGKPLPRVRFWEIGNEPYLKDEGQKKLWMEPEAFGAKAGRVIRAMKAVDPSIRVGIPLRSDTIGRIPATPYPGFNEKALKAVGTDFEFVSLHNAYSPLAMDKKYRDDQLAMAGIAAAQVVRDDFERTRGQLRQIFPGRRIGLAVTEYNALYSLGGRDTDRYIATLGGALIVADMLREFADTPDLELANYWGLTGNWHFGAISKEGRLRPAYHVLQLYREALQGNMLPARVEAPRYDTPAVGLVPAMKGVPLVSALATGDARKTRLLLINKDPANAANIDVSLAGGATRGTARVTSLYGSSYFSEDVSTRQTAAEPDNAGGTPRWKFSMPPHSLALVEWPSR